MLHDPGEELDPVTRANWQGTGVLRHPRAS
jgi:hypothetical protein